MHHKGFTLIEILIALFVFTIVSVILMSALHNVINQEGSVEAHAEQLRDLQLTMLLISRDVEQAVNRPIVEASGKSEAAFVGTPQAMTFTHAGFANPTGVSLHSDLQRVRYEWQHGVIMRVTWGVLDRTVESTSHTRQLMNGVEDFRFEYLDKNNRFHAVWPVTGLNQPLPRAVRIQFTLPSWGTLSQLYVINAEQVKLSPGEAT